MARPGQNDGMEFTSAGEDTGCSPKRRQSAPGVDARAVIQPDLLEASYNYGGSSNNSRSSSCSSWSSATAKQSKSSKRPRRAASSFRSWLRIPTLLCVQWAAEAQTDLQYGIIVDAGSSGSRIHVYTWRYSVTNEIELLEDALLKTEPGLSSFASNLSGVPSSLGQLLDHAKHTVPARLQSSTPLFLMATAGLRSKGDSVATDILEAASAELSRSPFLFRRDWAYVMSGEDEGIYGWIAVNYLLGALGRAATEGGTSAVIDLGGGSVQMVYEQTVSEGESSDSVAQVRFSDEPHQLRYQSHMGFGLLAAREQVMEDIALNAAPASADEPPFPHPCYPMGHTMEFRSKRFMGVGSFVDCKALYLQHLDKNDLLSSRRGQVALPEKIFGFSFLYDRTGAIGLLDSNMKRFGTYVMTVADISEAATGLCSSNTSTIQARFAEAFESEKWADFCSDVTYIATLLEHGFGIDPATEITMGNKVGNFEVVWTVGAIMAKVIEVEATRSEL